MEGWGNARLFWALGVVFIVFGLYSIIRRRKLLKSPHTVTGQILRYEEFPDTGIQRGSTGILYHPVIRFDTPSGTVEHVSRIGSSMRLQNSGASVNVHYNPKDPAQFEVLSDRDQLRQQTLPLIAGVVFLALATALSF
ncbi:DUF3592 domain-containing protein [Saccharibacillus sp. JS10]|uniref:DUF3592 domain-containing protein n=1 Tax=Saccharibacillus sp. JS10 TaxID=2950552 RepID=UPI00210DEF22|nr:DUF3592 domain-containing protein [Saccharibacillus sp. JS10]MCQ4085538.1 DUF3592 domain-containing protein [Saccharibacillus sp. JS10]